ncbi:MAG TPA: 2-oxo-4-hydroxy-4-carboxy-5-ureidoimidazoline decarboxylase [Dongiaceae bacterium]|jgi:OHCU decarboxylase|nr:2-oxo-4-hydroxy-4-carboxy-5-ureidoimidazoline decarboxylase [Dongiaceae bacterium]
MAQTLKRPPSTLDRTQFVALYGRVYEHSPWIVEAAWRAGLTPDGDTVEGLHQVLAAIVDEVPREWQLALLCAHPDLAGRLAVGGALTAESSSEQTSAGLDQCTPEEFQRFTALNDAYKRRFPFPFIMAVKGKSRREILEVFERRMQNDEDAEFRTALSEVHKIAFLRLRDL